MSHKFDPKTAVYTPAQVATYGIKAAKTLEEAVKNGAGLDFPITDIAEYFSPALPTQLVSVIAQTSNFKSGFMYFWEHDIAKSLMAKPDYKEAGYIIIHVSVEDTIEEQAYLEMSMESSAFDATDIARGTIQDWGKLEEAAVRVGDIPIYRIGESLARPEDMPYLSITNMIRAINVLVNGDILDWKPKVAGIFFDYLQAFPLDEKFAKVSRDGRRRLQVRSDIYKLRQCGAYYNCPIVVAVQAKQAMTGAHPPIMLPGVYDGEESSSIGQRSDRVVTLWMPKMTHKIGDSIGYGIRQFYVEEDLLWVKVAKQRGRLPSGKAWPCRIDFNNNTVSTIQDW